MDNPWDEVMSAMAEARELNYACDRNATSMAKLIQGRLRQVDSWVLQKLKRELRDFNSQTKEWK